MAIRAYDELYLPGAQNILGHAVDFAVMTLAIEPNVFGNALAVSESAKQFSEGNPRYIAGVNGCELARFILDDVGVAYRESADEMFLDKSPEYWAGWALAYYQWFTALSFMEILRAMSLDDIIRMYPLYHEERGISTNEIERKAQQLWFVAIGACCRCGCSASTDPIV